jgi:type III restriction enzyme
VYFLNIQKLGKDKNLVTKGDDRHYTIWETIINTEKQLGDRFYLIIDEAHRGMNHTPHEENARKTIVQKFVLGEPDIIPPINLILGISATPQRFQRLLQDTQRHCNRTLRTVQIKLDDVRSSGLLKDKIVLFHPEVDQPSDWALLAAAARRWVQMCDEWNAYTTSQGIPPIHPAMVIQVENGNGHVWTRTDLALVIKTLENAIGPIKDEELAHGFQEDGAITVGDRKIQKIEASRIQEETVIKFNVSST